MATKSENSEIAVLQSQMDAVLKQLDGIDKKLDEQAKKDEHYVTQSQFKSFKVITVPLVILVSAVITALVYFYLSNRHTLTTPDIQNNTVSSTPSTSGTSTPSTSSSSTTSSTTSSPATTPPASSPSSSSTPSTTGGVQVTIPKLTP